MLSLVEPGRGLDDLLLDSATRDACRNAWAHGPLRRRVRAVAGAHPAGSRRFRQAQRRRGAVPRSAEQAAGRGPRGGAARPGAGCVIPGALVGHRRPGRARSRARRRGGALAWPGSDARPGAACAAARRPAASRSMPGARHAASRRRRGWQSLAAGFPRRGAIVLRLPEPSSAQRRTQWLAGLAAAPLDAGADLTGVATRFRLSLGRISQAAATARLLAGRWPAPRPGSPRATYRRPAGCIPTSGSRRWPARSCRATGWDDIVLPDDRVAQLREICNQREVPRRGSTATGASAASSSLGKGLDALFAGPVRHRQDHGRRDHRRRARPRPVQDRPVDRGQQVHRRDREEPRRASSPRPRRRTPSCSSTRPTRCSASAPRCSDAHDRYANIEVSYLLQRMEEYEGVAILATNLRKNIDEAFVRRLHFTVDFPFPDEAERRRIWQRHLARGDAASTRSSTSTLLAAPLRARRRQHPQHRRRRGLPGRRRRAASVRWRT